MTWTDADNKATINQLLDFYADLLSEFSDAIPEMLGSEGTELLEKLQALQMLQSLATTIDSLLKRWSFAHRGYDGNVYQAREYANVAAAQQESETDTERDDTVQRGDDTEGVEVKFLLRERPEMTENGHPIDGETPAVSLEPVPMQKPPVKKRKKGDVAAEIFKVLEMGEQTTAGIAGAIGRSERSVRRDMKLLIAGGKVTTEKKGVYRLHRSVKWTEADNAVLINAVLAVYTALIDICKGDVKEIFAAQEIRTTEKIRCVKTFNASVATIDRLMKRWSLVHLGWHSNTLLAKADAAVKTQQAEKAALESAPLEAFFQIVAHYHPSMRELMENLPPPIKPPDDENGTWSYDAVTQELFAPLEREPISEAEARKRLIQRKSARPAALILYA